MRRDHISMWSHAMGLNADVLVYGNFGRPVLAFPSEAGRCTDYESNGMVDAIVDLIDGGRVKLYCVDAFDEATWSDRGVPMEERARRHGFYEQWIVDQVVPMVVDDCGGRRDILVTGPSLGAFHAANFALRRADLFPVALCQSGVYDVASLSWSWGERGEAVYFNNPMDYVANLGGDHLEWLRSQLTVVLTVGQGSWEDSTGALESTRRFGGLLAEKGIRHEVDVWGHDVAHDWPWWRRQLAHHLPRFC